MAFGAPIDPNYIAFRNGYIKASADLGDRYRWRWSPKHHDWYVYSAADWILDDIGIPDTAGAWSSSFSGSFAESAADLYLPKVFESVGAQYGKYSGRWPGLVWTFLNGGDWRVAISRTPQKPPTTTPGKVTPLPQQALDQIAQVQEFVRQGLLSQADGQRLTRDIIAKWTVGTDDAQAVIADQP